MAAKGGSPAPNVRTRVVLFTDLVASTPMRVLIGDTAADEVRRTHDSLLDGAVTGLRGEVIKSMGDGIMAVFQSAADAVACAVRMQQAISRLSKRVDVSLSIRIGVSAGDVAFEDGDWYGTPVVEAARLGAAAAGDEILVADVVRVLAGSRSGAVFESCGALRLKGFDEPMVCWFVRWDDTTDAPLIAFPPALVTGGLDFVGRQHERALLARLYSAALEGRRGGVLIVGEPGAGKTRLAAEIAATVHTNGAIVLAGRCDEQLAVPYQPFVEALRFFVEHAPDDCLSSLDRFAEDLIPLAPELENRVTNGRERLRADPEIERYRLFEAFTAWLRALSTLEPVVLVLDDVQWASRPTVLLLRHVLRDREPARVLIIATYRSGEAPASHPFSEMVAELAGDDAVHKMVLEGLGEDDVTELLRDAVGTSWNDVDASLGRDLTHRSGGNPFFATELVRAVAEADGDEITAIPSSARAAVHRRLTRLSETAQQTATVGAISGLTFELDVVSQVVGKQPHELLDALDELSAAHIVVEERGALGRYAFAHALVRTALTTELSETRRSFLHRDVARAIEKHHRDALDDHLAALAQHYTAAGSEQDWRRAAEFSLEAGLQAAARLASEEAETLYRLGLAANERCLEPDNRVRCELLIALGDQLVASSAIRELVREAFDIAAELRLPVHMAQAAAMYADAGEPGRPIPRAVEMSSTALDMLGDEYPELRSMIHVCLATYFTVSEADGARGDEHALEGIAEARRVKDLRTTTAPHHGGYLMWDLRDGSALHRKALLWALAARILVLTGWTPVGQRAAILEEMRGLGQVIRAEEDEDDFVVREDVRMGLPVLIETGDGDGARAQLERFHKVLASGTPVRRHAALAALYDGMIASLDGRFDDAEASAATLLSIATSRDSFGLGAAAQAALVLRERGRLGEMRSALQATVRSNARISFAQGLLGLAYIEQNQIAEAEQVLQEMTADDLALVSRDSMWNASVACLAEIACVVGARRRVDVLYRLLSPYSGQAIVLSWGVACVGSGDRYLAMLADADERWDTAERHFVDAIEIETRLQAPPLLARTKYWYARMLDRRGAKVDHERARALLDEASATAYELGATELHARCRELLR